MVAVVPRCLLQRDQMLTSLLLTDAMESDSNNGNSDNVQVFDESSHKDEVSASLMQSTHVSEDLVSASIDPIKGS